MHVHDLRFRRRRHCTRAAIEQWRIANATAASERAVFMRGVRRRRTKVWVLEGGVHGPPPAMHLGVPPAFGPPLSSWRLAFFGLIFFPL